MNVKQVIVARRDLHCRKGKLAAQVAHASLKVFFDRMRPLYSEGLSIAPRDDWDWPLVKEWIDGSFTKIVLGCQDEPEILALEAKAKEAGLPTALVVDNGLTEFHGVKTVTCLAIGPDDPEKIDKVTGHLTPL